MQIALLTLFPEALEPYLRASILGVAQEKGLVRVQTVDFRDFTRDRHRTVDDRPYGGGPGMVLKPEPVFDCVEWLEREHGPYRKILLTPDGERFRQPKAHALAKEERLLFLAGRYEGFDERLRSELAWDEVSLGDFVLSGGELAALCVIEAIARLVPGVLGHHESALRESFEQGSLDHPHYTRPPTWRGRNVPDVLKSGDHAAIERWRANEAHQRTRARRPDLLQEPQTKTA
ncbi:MAG: tRNA (guanosine(37)-N1)-methyltransferase TrmD [Planctomycetes bacterium]|nr:tRNA (guanosine(37)-N1)-methyltransferase TrmD [Planctomycetota bacterium]